MYASSNFTVATVGSAGAAADGLIFLESNQPAHFVIHRSGGVRGKMRGAGPTNLKELRRCANLNRRAAPAGYSHSWD